ncbi:MAG: hypothetical protein AB3N16_15675 [Flavobacteriaceae bacterium]
MDFFANIWCWLIPLLCTLLGGIIGYLMGKGGRTVIDNSADLQLLRDKNTKLEADLAACRGKLAAKVEVPKASITADTGIAAIPFDAAAAKAVYGKTIKQDDLKVVEGIGPKIEGMFKDAGIKTWKALSESSVADCQRVLDGGGDRYKIHDPASWPMQAKMAYEGKWKELLKWQDEHDHGRL